MTQFTDLETEIMQCWQITEDIDALYRYVMDVVDYGKLDSDQIANVLLGMKALGDIKFSSLFATYEALLKERRGL